MSITQRFREAERAKEADEDKEEGGEEKVQGPTLKEILKDNEKSPLFALYLREQGNEELIGKLISGDLSSDELEQLSVEREGFLRVMETVNELKGHFKARNINELVKSSPELQRIADLVGNEGISAALLRSFDRLAIEHPDDFDRIKDAAEELDRTSEALTAEDKNVMEICRKYNITENEYLEALKGDGDAINQLVESKMSGWKKFFSSRETINREVSEADRHEEIKRLSDEHDESFTAVAGALRTTLTGNEAMQNAIIMDLMGQRPEKEEKELSYSEFMNAPMDGSKIQGQWEAHRKLHENEPDFSEDVAKANFTEDYMNMITKKKKGLWSTFAKLFWKPVIENSLK